MKLAEFSNNLIFQIIHSNLKNYTQYKNNLIKDYKISKKLI